MGLRISLLFFLTFSYFHIRGQEKPNVILIITDEHNFRTIGAHRDLLPADEALMWGNTVVETPNIDRIGNEGAVFTSMYVAAPVCTASRAALMTGQCPLQVSSGDNDRGISTSENTIAKVFRNEGYATGYVGKWHLSQDRQNGIEHKPGWMLNDELRDYDYGFDDKNFMFNRGHYKQFEIIDNPGILAPAGEKIGNDLGTSSIGTTSTNFSTDWLTDRAIEFIDQNNTNPFFCVISYPDPHGPNNVRAPYDTMYSGNAFELPTSYRADGEGIPNEDTGIYDPASWTIASGGNTRTEQQVKDLIPTYFGMVKCIDDNIAKLFDKLTAENILDNTIIVFTSDHGDLLGEHGRENKGQPYEASALVPFLIRYPSKISAGTVVNTAVNNSDVMDTLISLAGLQGFDYSSTSGNDITGMIDGTISQPEINGITLNGITFCTLNNWYAAFSDRFKLIFERSTTSTKKIPWLIDLEVDATERSNFIDPATGKAKPGYKAIAKTLAEKLDIYCSALTISSGVKEQLNILINDNISTDVSVISSKR